LSLTIKICDEEIDNKNDAANVKTGRADRAEEGGDSDSNDDAIEEVNSSVARDKAMEQLAKERKTLKARNLQTRTRKRKAKTATAVEEEEEDFDGEFIEQVHSEMAEQRKQKKIDKEAVGACRPPHDISVDGGGDGLTSYTDRPQY